MDAVKEAGGKGSRGIPSDGMERGLGRAANVPNRRYKYCSGYTQGRAVVEWTRTEPVGSAHGFIRFFLPRDGASGYGKTHLGDSQLINDRRDLPDVSLSPQTKIAAVNGKRTSTES